MKGAIDDVDKIIGILDSKEIQSYYIHCDAALLGMILPFMPIELPFHFEKRIDSLIISGHKFLGCPIPAGIFITRDENANLIRNDIEYISSHDITIGESRYGLPAMVMLYLLHTKENQMSKEIDTCLENSKYLMARLTENAYPCFINPVSITVVLRKPKSQELIEHYQLAVQGDLAHIVVLPHIDKRSIDRFIENLLHTESIQNEDKECAETQPAIYSP